MAKRAEPRYDGRAEVMREKLGTGHGEREWSQVSHTAFERAQSTPNETIRIRYDSHENLVALGVIPGATPAPRPDAFPGSPVSRYVPDPPLLR